MQASFYLASGIFALWNTTGLLAGRAPLAALSMYRGDLYGLLTMFGVVLLISPMGSITLLLQVPSAPFAVGISSLLLCSFTLWYPPHVLVQPGCALEPVADAGVLGVLAWNSAVFSGGPLRPFRAVH